MRTSLLITTLNRPEELRRALASVLGQTVLPDEIVVVDATDGRPETPLAEEIRAAGIRLHTIHAERGRTRQLNIGIRACTEEVVIVIDDDVVLDPGFVRGMRSAFERQGPRLGVAQGLMENDTLRPWPARALRALFLQPRHTVSSPGRMLRSGYYTVPIRPSTLTRAEAVRLTATAFRRQALLEFPLDEDLHGYALKEDIDLSYRIGRRYLVVVNPDARFQHLKTPTARIAIREKSAMHVVNNFWFFSKHLRGSRLNELAFAWAMLGRLGAELARSVVKREPAYALGTLDGLRTVARERRRRR
jgi:GT2 family glycosyltransferase